MSRTAPGGHVTDPGIVQAKLVPPRIPDAVVRRERLNERLDRHLGRVILFSAPAGCGKTVLLLDWLAAADRPVAWLSVDSFDNDPVRFFAHLAAAVGGLPCDAAARAAELIRDLGSGTGSAPMTGPLAEALEALGRDSLLVLDDLHELDSPPVLATLEKLMDPRIGGPRVVLLTRMDPSLGLARMRLDGELLQLRESDLRFTRDEAAEFLERILPGRLTEDQVVQLDRRTEGWAAGLRMAAVALQDAEDVDSIVDTFAGSDRYIVEYLLEEAIERQSPELRQFVMDTSLLRRFRADTCVAVTGDPEAGALLEQAERQNLFLVPLGRDRRWYRYHRLFGELLEFRLRRLQPERLETLHRRASTWFEQEGDINAAMDHASRLADPGRLAELLDAHALDLLSRSEVATLRRWLGCINDALSQPYPMMLAIAAWLRILTDRAPDLQPVLDAIDRALEQVPPSYDRARRQKAALQREVLGAFAARYARRYEEALELSAGVLERVPGEDALMVGLLTFNMARAHMGSAEMRPAAELLQQSFEHNSRASNFYLVLAGLGQAAAVSLQTDGVPRASDAIASAVRFAGEQGLASLPAFSTVLYHEGYVHYLADALENAAQSFDAAIGLSRGADFPEGLANGLIGRARVATALRNFDHAESLLVEAAALAQASNAILLDTTVSLEQTRLAFARHVAGVGAVSTQVGDASVRRWTTVEETAISLGIWQALRADRHALAGELARRLETESRQRGRGVALCTALLARALLANETERWKELDEVLRLSAAHGWVRPFLDGGEPVRALIDAASARPLSGVARAQAAFLADRFGAHATASAPASGARGSDLLTDREREVLAHLFEKRSNKAIARAMFVSVETVKTHLKHLYAKLGVRSRREAVSRAREIGAAPPATTSPS